MTSSEPLMPLNNSKRTDHTYRRGKLQTTVIYRGGVAYTTSPTECCTVYSSSRADVRKNLLYSIRLNMLQFPRSAYILLLLYNIYMYMYLYNVHQWLAQLSLLFMRACMHPKYASGLYGTVCSKLNGLVIEIDTERCVESYSPRVNPERALDHERPLFFFFFLRSKDHPCRVKAILVTVFCRGISDPFSSLTENTYAKRQWTFVFQYVFLLWYSFESRLIYVYA